VARLDVALPDALGVLGLVAGVLSLRHVRILGAEVQSVRLGKTGTIASAGPAEGRNWAVQRWTVAAEFGGMPDPARLRTDLKTALAGTLDLAARMASRDADHRPGPRARTAGAPVVRLLGEEASAVATVLVVRAADTPGLLYRICRAISAAGADIATARVATLGAEAVDTFYLREPGGEALDAAAAEAVADRVRAALNPAPETT